ncbi:MAG: Asp-tRNA(Asn)/Glu-tRNA(Gln) amidotransferase subunit GatC [Eubacteriales bacterium]|nr:Asp-tRNA(Asn)/Glu-tRNA(Gln) amidotransferase subunit GatC [Eubacteriales bacterium]
MDREILRRLESLNQLRLTEEEKEKVLSFFEMQDKEITRLGDIDTEKVERMVHVMPMNNVIREDVVNKVFTRDELQAAAPEAYDGYWQVPRLVE